ncbi:MAG: hypothetical protein AAF485_08955 [Chloroflexota bacterium]
MYNCKLSCSGDANDDGKPSQKLDATSITVTPSFTAGYFFNTVDGDEPSGCWLARAVTED